MDQGALVRGGSSSPIKDMRQPDKAKIRLTSAPHPLFRFFDGISHLKACALGTQLQFLEALTLTPALYLDCPCGETYIIKQTACKHK